ncbi:regulator of chromosome condensation, putative [Plasmodium ovale]|uniref:Regulator of chromosome condensation, putative n=2 Tax=Plasmodium ovale TaxID=36330 RepID=A0A1A8X744_PLAOA|nr:regulator of chromosome condensation, putative [Plasmodium ovale curtisi]SBS99602.1 regulator of chromosome condensation, putative [Plasmodium ovale curtisi]SCA48325.1 regulator of chromosome condensation, putative [Plasmodium ovale]
MFSRIPRIFAVALNGYFLVKGKEKIIFCQSREEEERVFLFGDRRSLIKDMKQNGEAVFFANNKIKVKKITFGDSIGSCITEDGDIYIWGSYEDKNKKEIIYVDPMKVSFSEGANDMQFSQNDVFIISNNGELKIVRNYKDSLKKKEFIIEHFYKCKSGFFFQNEKIVKLSVNKFHLAFVTNKGNVYCSGNNFYGQCAKEPSFKNNINVNYNFEFSKNMNTAFGMMNNGENVQRLIHYNGEDTAGEYADREQVTDRYSITVSEEDLPISISGRSSHDGVITPQLSSNRVNIPGKSKLKDGSDHFKESNFSNREGKQEEEKQWNGLIGRDETYLCDQDNYVHMNKVLFEEKTQIVDVSCGLNHTLCVDDKNNIYSFGDDSKIQLGLGESRTNKNSLAGTRWKDQLKLGYSTITKNLANYSFYDRHIQSSPQKILKKINDNEIIDEIYKINAGSNFTMIHSNDKFGKQLFCFGDNMYFQCGRHLGKHQHTLSTVKLPNNKIKDFSCGDKHCLLNLNDKLYGWGYNNKYQISPFKNKGIINYPVYIFSEKHYPDNAHIKYVNAKYNNSAVVITHNKVS